MRVRIISPAAVRAEMKSNAIAAVGVALVDLPLAFEPHPVFWIARAEMEGSAGTALARVAVAQINPIRFTCCNHSKRAAMALADPFHGSPPTILCARHFDLCS